MALEAVTLESQDLLPPNRHEQAHHPAIREGELQLPLALAPHPRQPRTRSMGAPAAARSAAVPAFSKRRSSFESSSPEHIWLCVFIAPLQTQAQLTTHVTVNSKT